jgi:Tol biopolymer transport system component
VKAFLLAFAFAAPLTTPSPSPHVVVARLGTRQTWFPAGAYAAAASRDGTLLALARDDELVLTSPPFARKRVVTMSTSTFFDPAISPDDRSIAYDGGIVGVNGSMRALAVSEPDWASDSRRVVGVDAAGRVVVVVARDGATKELGAGDAPHWQPRGDLIAYDTPTGRLTVVRADGTRQRRVARAAPGTATWARDGTRLVYVGAGRNATGPLLSWSPKTGRTTRLAFLSRGRPVWSPDGRRLLFAGPPRPLDPWRLLTIPARGGRTRVVGDAGLDPIRRVGWLKGAWIVSIEYRIG